MIRHILIGFVTIFWTCSQVSFFVIPATASTGP
jgi:hypothetical protein